MGLNAYARSQGISPQTVGLPDEQRAFLEAAPGLSRSPCRPVPRLSGGLPPAMVIAILNGHHRLAVILAGAVAGLVDDDLKHAGVRSRAVALE
jgi:hypothetical protein